MGSVESGYQLETLETLGHYYLQYTSIIFVAIYFIYDYGINKNRNNNLALFWAFNLCAQILNCFCRIYILQHPDSFIPDNYGNARGFYEKIVLLFHAISFAFMVIFCIIIFITYYLIGHKSDYPQYKKVMNIWIPIIFFCVLLIDTIPLFSSSAVDASISIVFVEFFIAHICNLSGYFLIYSKYVNKAEDGQTYWVYFIGLITAISWLVQLVILTIYTTVVDDEAALFTIRITNAIYYIFYGIAVRAVGANMQQFKSVQNVYDNDTSSAGIGGADNTSNSDGKGKYGPAALVAEDEKSNLLYSDDADNGDRAESGMSPMNIEDGSAHQDAMDDIKINDDDKCCGCCKRIHGLRFWNAWSIIFNLMITALLLAVAILFNIDMLVTALIMFFIRMGLSIYGIILVKKRNERPTSYGLYGLLSLIISISFNIILMAFFNDEFVMLLYYDSDSINSSNNLAIIKFLLVLYTPFVMDFVIVTVSFAVYSAKAVFKRKLC